MPVVNSISWPPPEFRRTSEIDWTSSASTRRVPAFSAGFFFSSLHSTPPPRKKMTSEQATTAAKLKSATGAAWAAVIGGTVHGLLELPVGVSGKR